MYCFNKRYHDWVVNYLNTVNRNKEDNLKRALSALSMMLISKRMRKRDYKKKEYWVFPLLQKRPRHGYFNRIFPVLRTLDADFQNFCRMSTAQFEKLLNIIAPSIEKQMVVREPVSPAERLLMTLR